MEQNRKVTFMKKRIALMLSIVMTLAMMLTACGTDPTTVDYNGYSYDELEQNLYDNLGMVDAVSQVCVAFGIESADLKERANADYYNYLIQNGASDTQVVAAAEWDAVGEEFGTFTDYDENSFTVTKAGNTLTTDLNLIFTAADESTREVQFEVVYEYFSMEITGISINPVYSLGEKMSKAGMNTLISMLIVFCVLILISLIIYAFNIFPYMEKKKKEKAAAKAAQSATDALEKYNTPAEEAEVTSDETDDTELIAVIAAAIAASEGTSTSDFVVRSINRR